MDDQMINHFAQERRLPCRSDRTKIIEQAKLVLAEARAVAKQLDGSFVALIATPAEGENVGTSSFVARGAAGGVLGDQF